ncbi:sialate O-acetylesterase [Lactiplantibacillus modestisalitolerans]|uniref:Sialate O-acetylesterase n=1 Tax=Lactiplantibacillus modestisalitolerans TaxID=1457219 RepID=A0ABV5WYY2_9LACO|nr:sialate O-acetylesterase [Lactiplantibacillus modestisalitolerans]
MIIEPRKRLVLISAGQSNIDGRNPLAELPAPITLPMTHVHYCSNYTAGHAQGRFQPAITADDLSAKRWGFDLATYYYLSQVANYDLYVMKCSEGGTSIDVTGESADHWTADVGQLSDPRHSLLRQLQALVAACQRTTPAVQTVHAMLWHQGEGDRADFSPAASAHYYDNLKAFFAACRETVRQPQLPIFCGTVSHRSTQYDPQVEASLLRLARADPNLHVIDLKDATLRDNFHFDPTSSVAFGKALYEVMRENLRV